MSKTWERVFSALYDPLLWVGERAGMAKRRQDLLAEASGRVLELGAGAGSISRTTPRTSRSSLCRSLRPRCSPSSGGALGR